MKNTLSEYGTNPEYIGDGVYIVRDTFDCMQFWLMTERENDIHRIAISTNMLSTILNYAAKMINEMEKTNES